LPDVERIQQSGGHALDTVGCNDDWRYNNGFAALAPIAALRGAFVLHNVWACRPLGGLFNGNQNV
jgi:hypothetical protein